MEGVKTTIRFSGARKAQAACIWKLQPGIRICKQACPSARDVLSKLCLRFVKSSWISGSLWLRSPGGREELLDETVSIILAQTFRHARVLPATCDVSTLRSAAAGPEQYGRTSPQSDRSRWSGDQGLSSACQRRQRVPSHLCHGRRGRTDGAQPAIRALQPESGTRRIFPV